ncbi:uncharacterized protein [Venturia canescens]|uniref:uncharacterized protein n=1 Tax=Venturia canescens TaxID=32260 RepID=UPI001C9CCA48|nr:uncharacterized protein LOC122415947 [Venturia canescens]
MEKRNCAAILLLVFGVIGVYSYPQNSNKAVNGAVPDVSGLDPHAEVESINYLLLDDENPSSRMAYQVDGRPKRSPGGPKKNNDKWSQFLQQLRNANLQPIVLPNPTPQEMERNRLMAQFNNIVHEIMRQRQISYDDAVLRARNENLHLYNQILQAHGMLQF